MDSEQRYFKIPCQNRNKLLYIFPFFHRPCLSGLLQLVLPGAPAWSLQPQVLWQAVLPILFEFKPIIIRSDSVCDTGRYIVRQKTIFEVHAWKDSVFALSVWRALKNKRHFSGSELQCPFLSLRCRTSGYKNLIHYTGMWSGQYK